MRSEIRQRNLLILPDDGGDNQVIQHFAGSLEGSAYQHNREWALFLRPAEQPFGMRGINDAVGDLWHKAQHVWEEDDAFPEGAETAGEAWARLRPQLKDEQPVFIWNDGDASLHFYKDGTVQCCSYRGNNSIRQILPGVLTTP